MIAKIDRVLAFCNVYPKSHPSSRYSLNAAAYMPHKLSTWLCPSAVFFYCIANGRVSNCWVTALCLKVCNECVLETWKETLLLLIHTVPVEVSP